MSQPRVSLSAPSYRTDCVQVPLSFIYLLLSNTLAHLFENNSEHDIVLEYTTTDFVSFVGVLLFVERRKIITIIYNKYFL